MKNVDARPRFINAIKSRDSFSRDQSGAAPPSALGDCFYFNLKRRAIMSHSSAVNKVSISIRKNVLSVRSLSCCAKIDDVFADFRSKPPSKLKTFLHNLKLND